jgi:hypothetical protein
MASDLEKRLQVLEDERAILDTLHRYPHCIDYTGRAAEFVDLFTDDGVFDIRHAPPLGRKIVGRKALEQFIKGHRTPEAKYHQHGIINSLISFKGNEAFVESYWLTLDRGVKGPSLGGCGRYKDHLVKQGSRWKFKERIIEIEVLDPDSH